MPFIVDIYENKILDMGSIENIDIFEVACKYFSQKISEFQEILSMKVKVLENIDWKYDKGTTKVCKPDENGKRKRCKAGLEYHSKVVLSMDDVEIVWNEFNEFFVKTYTTDIERISANEEIGRYEFIATNLRGDRVQCMIYLSGEWNIPQISILTFVTERYRSIDVM